MYFQAIIFILALYSNHDLEKERLEEFCASDGTDDRWDYANRPRRSLAESLADFPNTITTFPIEAIFELDTRSKKNYRHVKKDKLELYWGQPFSKDCALEK